MRTLISTPCPFDCKHPVVSDIHSLPGADRLALRTGAIVIGNGEALNCLRRAGVPEEQLMFCAGGERIPLFDRETRQKVGKGELPSAPGPPGAPALPEPSLAALSVHVWPSLHCLMPGQSHADIPDVMDTGKVYTGSASQYACTLDITRGMKHGLLRIGDHVPPEKRDKGMQSFIDYINPSNGHVYSAFDGGQLSYNFLIGDRALFWNAHLGAYSGILASLEPKPDVLIQAIAGRANLNGRPYDGSAAEFAAEVSKWLGQPKDVIWCLHDDAPIAPYSVDVGPATRLLEASTKSVVRGLQPATLHHLSGEQWNL